MSHGVKALLPFSSLQVLREERDEGQTQSGWRQQFGLSSTLRISAPNPHLFPEHHSACSPSLCGLCLECGRFVMEALFSNSCFPKTQMKATKGLIFFPPRIAACCLSHQASAKGGFPNLPCTIPALGEDFPHTPLHGRF